MEVCTRPPWASRRLEISFSITAMRSSWVAAAWRAGFLAACFWPLCLGASAWGALSWRGGWAGFWFESTTKLEQAVRHSSLDLSVPMPTTSMPALRSRTDSAEKSLSLEAMMAQSMPPCTSRSMAPMTSAMSELFLPLAALMVRLGCMAYFSTGATQEDSAEAAPKISLLTTSPSFFAWAKIRSAWPGNTFSASMSMAIFIGLSSLSLIGFCVFTLMSVWV